jgi:multiple sugar transport system permease protein
MQPSEVRRQLYERRGRRPWSRALLPYVLVAPCMLLLGGLLLYPLADEMYLSLTHWNLLYQASARYVGFSTYAKLFQDSIFWSSLWRTCEWTVGTVIIEFAVALPLAMALNHRTRLTGLATGLILLPWIAPTTVVSYAWVWILDSQFGFVTAALRTVHLVGSTSPLASYSSALPAVVVASGWKGAPFMAILLLAALKGIPAELHEAAQIDGAGFFRRHVHITLPALRKTALVSGMLLAIWAFYSFDFAWLMTQGGPGDATELAAVYLFKTYQWDLNYSYAAEIGMGMFAILAAVIVVYLATARPNKEV